MSVHVKHFLVASQLSQEILRGALAPGARLPGEHALAERFEVSRGTIRQALARLEADGVIEKHAGAGSFVAFQGHHLDERLGWSRALAEHGVQVTTEILTLAQARLPGLAAELRLRDDAFLALDRRRSLASGEVVSLERSRLPWRSEFAAVLEVGLLHGSLTATLRAIGIRVTGGRERVGIARLEAGDAAALGAQPGSPFLVCDCTTYQRGDRTPVERVTTLMDPHHFTLEASYGEMP